MHSELIFVRRVETEQIILDLEKLVEGTLATYHMLNRERTYNPTLAIVDVVAITIGAMRMLCLSKPFHRRNTHIGDTSSR